MGWTRPTVLLLWLSVLAAAGASAAPEPGLLNPIMFPPAGTYGPAFPSPLNDESALSSRMQVTRMTHRPVGRASAALRGVAARLRSLVAPSVGVSGNDGSGNLLMSPLSVAAALGQLLLGAQGETRGLLADLLAAPSASGGGAGGVPDLDYHQQFKALLEMLGAEDSAAGAEAVAAAGVELRVASAFFAQKDLPLRVDFQHALHDLYHADIRHLDFRERPAVAQASVNAWARQATRGRIPTVLAAPLPPSAAALVASAVYFRGAWEWPFDSDLSVNGWFRMSPRRRVAVKFMRSHFPEMRYAENAAQGYRLVVLPYKDGQTAMYVILPDQKDADLSAFSTQMSLERMISTARSAPPHTVTLVLPRMSISGSFSLKEPLSKLKGMRRPPRSVQEPRAEDSRSPAMESEIRPRLAVLENGFKNLESWDPSQLPDSHSGSSPYVSSSKAADSFISKFLKRENPQSESLSPVPKSTSENSDSKPFTVLSGGSFESDNLRKRRGLRSDPEPRFQDSQFPPMQIGMNSPQVSFRMAFPQPPVIASSDTKKSNPGSTARIVVDEMLPDVRSASINKPMVLGVPLRILDSDDSNILPKIPIEYSSQEKDQLSGKPLQHSFRGMEIPYPYRPPPGQELKPPFDKPPKLLTIKDILPRIVVGTSVSFPFDQSNESAPIGSKLTTRPSGLISKKQRERVGSTQVRSATEMEDEYLVSEGSASPVALVNNNSTHQIQLHSDGTTLRAEESVDSVRVSLNIPGPKNQNSTDKTLEEVTLSSSPAPISSSPYSTFPTPMVSFLSNVEYSVPIPIISSSVHVEHSSSVDDVSPSLNAPAILSSSLNTSASTSPKQTTENRFSPVNSNLSVSPSETQSSSSLDANAQMNSPATPTNSTHSKLPDFPEIEETGDLLNPLAVGAQGLWTIRPQPANYDVYDDVVLDLTGASADRALRVSDALHHVWLEVTETGTEAAAVTATIADYSGDNQVMKVDRPFVLAIVHEPTEALLFLAAVSDPTGGTGIRTDIPPKKTPPNSTG